MTTNLIRKMNVGKAKRKKLRPGPKPYQVNLGLRFKRELRKKLPTKRMSKYCGLFTSGAVTYLIAELLDMAKENAVKDHRKIIHCKDIGNAIRNDSEFNELLRDVIMGCFPFKQSNEERKSILNYLMTKKGKHKPIVKPKPKKPKMRKPRVSKVRKGQGAKGPIDMFARIQKRIPDTGLTAQAEMDIIERELEKISDLGFPFSCKVCTSAYQNVKDFRAHKPNSYECKQLRYNVLTNPDL